MSGCDAQEGLCLVHHASDREAAFTPRLAENFTRPVAPRGDLAPRQGNTARRPYLKARVPEPSAAEPTASEKTAINSSTHKGYTGHEQLDNLNLVHMKGRVYDSAIARFMSADPIIQSPFRSQSFNRYSYVWNNPLNATDPTGLQKEGIKDLRAVRDAQGRPAPDAGNASDDVKNGRGSVSSVMTPLHGPVDATRNSAQSKGNVMADTLDDAAETATFVQFSAEGAAIAAVDAATSGKLGPSGSASATVAGIMLEKGAQAVRRGTSCREHGDELAGRR